MQYIKGGYSFRLKSEVDVWQRSYDNRRIVDVEDFAERMRYVHQNPVRAHLVDQVDDYLFSSAGREGLIDPAPDHFGQ
jgi:putative transposase